MRISSRPALVPFSLLIMMTFVRSLPIRVRNVPLQGAKSRVETQLKVTIDLVWDPNRPAHFHHGSSLCIHFTWGLFIFF